jgi:hypothetical protein
MWLSFKSLPAYTKSRLRFSASKKQRHARWPFPANSGLKVTIVSDVTAADCWGVWASRYLIRLRQVHRVDSMWCNVVTERKRNGERE